MPSATRAGEVPVLGSPIVDALRERLSRYGPADFLWPPEAWALTDGRVEVRLTFSTRTDIVTRGVDLEEAFGRAVSALGINV